MVTIEYFLGRRTQFSYAIEDVAYGTANDAVTWAWLGDVQKFTPNDRFDIKEFDAMDDVDSRNPTEHAIMVKRYGGSIEFFPQHMRHLVLPFGVACDTYTTVHTLVPKDTLPSFGMQVGFHHTTDFGIQYDGCVVNKYEIGSTKGDFVRCTADIVAKVGAKITAFKAYQATSMALKKYTVAQLRPLRHSDVAVTIGDVVYSGALNSWRLSMDNGNVAEPHNADTINEPIPGLRKWSASFDINMASSALWDLKETAAEIGTTTVVITRTAGDDVTFTLNDPVIEVLNPPFDISAGLVNVTLSILCTSVSTVVDDAVDVDYDTVCA